MHDRDTSGNDVRLNSINASVVGGVWTDAALQQIRETMLAAAQLEQQAQLKARSANLAQQAKRECAAAPAPLAEVAPIQPMGDLCNRHQDAGAPISERALRDASLMVKTLDTRSRTVYVVMMIAQRREPCTTLWSERVVDSFTLGWLPCFCFS